ncbi:ribosome biogenesis GTP-binding protein YsxC, partial [bacterium]|nr:ribosome biogenesis GTP-binding protein YsxC [bacterium]
ARTSGKPGKTRLWNYFRVAGRFYLVDLPGYGYAKVSKSQRATWREYFPRYLASEDRAIAAIHLLDARHPPSDDDLEVAAWIRAAQVPSAVALTKIDKLGTNERPRRYTEIVSALGMGAEVPVFATSAARRIGRVEMWAWIDALLTANA